MKLVDFSLEGSTVLYISSIVLRRSRLVLPLQPHTVCILQEENANLKANMGAMGVIFPHILKWGGNGNSDNLETKFR